MGLKRLMGFKFHGKFKSELGRYSVYLEKTVL